MALRTVDPDERHETLVNQLCQYLVKEAASMPAEELLAVLSQVLGMMIAYQDQRKYTPAMIMELVQQNIEVGNRRAIDKLVSAPAGGSA